MNTIQVERKHLLTIELALVSRIRQFREYVEQREIENAFFITGGSDPVIGELRMNLACAEQAYQAITGEVLGK